MEKPRPPSSSEWAEWAAKLINRVVASADKKMENEAQQQSFNECVKL